MPVDENWDPPEQWSVDVDPERLFGYRKYDKVVAFVDLLGFSALSEEHRTEPEVFQDLQRVSTRPSMEEALEGANALSDRFIRFHRLIATAVEWIRFQDEASSITFSDCAFLATDKVYVAIKYASRVMTEAIEQRMPVRIGIGCGEFLIVRLQADFGMVNQDHVVQFLGSGVSRAHAAEHCGIKGLRILLHPTASTLLQHKEHRAPHPQLTRVIGIGEDEKANRVGVFQEVNYLWDPPYDPLRLPDIRAMHEAAPESEGRHYDATWGALNRMGLSEQRLENERRYQEHVKSNSDPPIVGDNWGN